MTFLFIQSVETITEELADKQNPTSFLSVFAEFQRLCVCVGSEEDDFQVPDESHHQHAESLPLPVHQPSAGMDGFPLQHALLY